MSEFNIVNKSKKPISKKDIIQDLKSLGIQEGDILLVHSSLSKIGWVIGKEIAVIQALLECVGKEGTVVMPSQSGGWSNPAYWMCPPVPEEWIETIKEEMPAFDPLYTPTRNMGRIADAFYRYPGSIRSNHPQVSFSANGKLSHEILDKHPLSFGLGETSPLQKLYDLDAKILLLGVGYENCTAIHLAEAKQEHILTQIQGARLTSGWTEFEEIVYDNQDFGEIGEAYEKEVEVKEGKVGQANCRLLSLRSIVDFAQSWMANHRKQVITLSKEEFSNIYNEYMVNDFPDDELKPLKYIINNPNAYYYGYYYQGLVGYANCVFQGEYCLLDYYAIISDQRNVGYGSSFLQALLDLYPNKVWIVESEVPYDDLSKRRIDFYKRNNLLQADCTLRLYGVDYYVLSNKELSKKEVEEAYALFYPKRIHSSNCEVL